MTTHNNIIIKNITTCEFNIFNDIKSPKLPGFDTGLTNTNKIPDLYKKCDVCHPDLSYCSKDHLFISRLPQTKQG